MKPIFKTIYGSHLYGSNVATSDTDIKGVYLGSAEEVLSEDVPSTFTQNTNKDSNRKNTAEDTDLQLTSLKKFLRDLASGQTYALEFLFSPEQFWVEKPDEMWLELIKNRDRLVSKNVTAMVSYARAQAYKYGDKGKRLDVFRDVVSWLESQNQTDKLKLGLYQELKDKHPEFISIHKKDNDISEVLYLDVNGVMVPTGSTVEYALDVYKPRLDEYGARARQAAADRGNDLKAIYHSVRIAHQAIELLHSGFITLPRPEAPLLLDLRNGKIPDLEMKKIVDDSFEKVRVAEQTSSLRANVDRKYIKEFLMWCNLWTIKTWNSSLQEDGPT
jgi:predicted nucleotidyltransferase